MPALLLRTYHGFDIKSTFFIEHSLKLLLSVCQIQQAAKGQSQFSKKFMDKFCSPLFCAFNHFIFFNKKLRHTKLLHTTAPGHKG